MITDTKKETALLLVRVAQGDKFKYYLVCDNEGIACAEEGTNCQHRLIKNIEDMYKEGFERKGNWPMSACLNWIYFEYSVIVLPSQDQVQKELVPRKGMIIHLLSHVSGFVHGLDIKNGRKYWDKGIKPNLIQIRG